MTGTSVFFSAWPKWTARVGEAARAGELDVVGAQHLQHLGPHEAHDQRHLEQAERDRGQDQRLQARGGEKPVVHQPSRTVSPRPKDGSQPSVTENR